MVQLHFDRNAVTCKIVYYGPGLSGKTTNLEIIHQKAPEDSRGDMVSIATRGDRTLYFDYLPLELGQVQGMETTFQLYTVPGQIYYNNTRKLVLQGVDGVVFVADSSASKLEENQESLRNLQENLQAIGLSLNDIPVVIQYNKRDLPDALPINELDAHINTRRLTTFEAIAKDGQGVFITLKEIGRQVIERINTTQAAPRRRTGNAVPKDVAKRSTEQPATSNAPQSLATPLAGQQPSPLGSFPTPVQKRQPPTKRLGNEAQTRMINQPPASFQNEASRHAPTEPQPAASSSKRTAVGTNKKTSSSTTRAASGASKTSKNLEHGGADPRERHLNKTKPPSLSQRRTHQLKELNDLGSTEPHLKKYRSDDAGKSSRFLRFIVGLFLAVLSIAIILTILTLFIPRVNQMVVPYLPQGLQDLLQHQGLSTPVDEPDVLQPSTPIPEPESATSEPQTEGQGNATDSNDTPDQDPATGINE